jgi:exopolyphosphatase/guanosine-5'-triphosphate,3'-diphosphate pyrophosphatase
VLDRVAALSLEDRIRKLGLREDRADVIVPAAIIFDRITTLARTDRIVVPRVGVKDGVLYDLAADAAEHEAHESELDRVSFAGAIALGRRYRFDESHARHVRDLSLSLFDQLHELHRLGEVSRRRLSTGALLHDIGQFVSYRRHHKHSWYLVMNSELPGLSPDDIRLAALLARYHRRSEPKDGHEGFGELPNAMKTEVQKLTALLRVADALDREHHKHVRRIVATRRRNEVLLNLETAEDTALEQWALKNKSPLFEKVFGLKLRQS